MTSPDLEAILEQILLRRGFDASSFDEFIRPNYERGLRDPYGLPDMSRAVERLVLAKERKEKVVIYGDYDIDGLCASAILLSAFASLGLRCEVFIPDRFEEGYGLNSGALKRLSEAGARLVVTVDCGTTALEAIEKAAKSGLDIIVTDHHEPGAVLPAHAVAVVNPKRADSQYGFKELAGSGVAFKLVQALQSRLPGIKSGQEKWLLDLAAFGTICDVVPLVDENRVLAYFGLKVWPRTRRQGLQALALNAGVDIGKVNSRSLGFVFGPRLNAAGRIEHAKTALALLTASGASAGHLAQGLEELNSQRRTLQKNIEQAAVPLAVKSRDPVIVIADADWSHGVVGIVASRLMEQLAKPVFIGQILPEGITKGSVRSFGEFSAAEALNQVRPLLLSGGGHHAAAGFSLHTKGWPDFVRGINDYYESLNLTNQERHLLDDIDIELNELDSINLELAEKLSLLEPFGHGNQEPVFRLGPLTVLEQRFVGGEKTHLKLKLTDSKGNLIEGIMFRAGSGVPGKRISVTASVSANTFNNQTKAELVIKNWQDIA